MKSSIILLVMATSHLASAVETDRSAWKWEAPVTVDQPGMVRLEIPPAVLDVSEEQNLDDLRIVSPSGVETPSVIEIPSEGREVSIVASGFKTELSSKTTVIEIALFNDEKSEALELVSPAREFLKSVTIAGRKGTEWQTLVENAVIFRQADGAERLRIPISEGAWENFRFTVDDERSQPIPFTGVQLISTGKKAVTILIFHASMAGEWRLITGNKSAKHPNYGLSPWSESLAAAGGQCLAPGPLKLKTDYQIPAALPGVDPAGAAIGLAEWTRRRSVFPASPGVIRLELDALALAGCQSGLGDLRLVQNGRQIPYLIKPGSVMREMKPNAVLIRNDPKRPTVSRWEILLPIASVPLVELAARSPAPMFSRRLIASIERKEDLGNARSEIVGQADWTKSGGADIPLAIKLGGLRMPRALMLETDHGDNPPISLDDVVLRFSAPSIAAKLTDSAPLFLYYGNPKASAPEYDLRLVRNELLAADSKTMDLGDEEMLKPGPPDKRAMDAGSPWLWVALAAVVAVLLVIVARLLPKSAG